MDLNQVLIQVMKSLGYSDKLIAKALDDLEKVIASRYYNRIVSLLPSSTTDGIETGDYQSAIEVARQTLDSSTLQECLIEITKETIDEYVEAVTNK